MDVKELAPALLAVSEMLEQANMILNPEWSRINVHVKWNFKWWSFAIDLTIVQNILEQIQWIFWSDIVDAILNAKDLLEIVGIWWWSTFVWYKLIQFVKKVKNQNITNVEINGDNNTILNITLQSGEIIQTSPQTYKLFQDPKIRKSLENIIHKPLHRNGIDVLETWSDWFIEYINKEDSEWFAYDNSLGVEIKSFENEKMLRLASISFREWNKRRLYDGDSTISATILDQDFLTDVWLWKIAFANKDILEVQLQTKQFWNGETIKSEHFILKVKRHIPTPKIQSLFNDISE